MLIKALELPRKINIDFSDKHLRKFEYHLLETMSKLITVFGATGNQGGSVVKYILNDSELSKEFKIRGITRDTSKPAAQELAKQGVELATVSEGMLAKLKMGRITEVSF